MHRLPTPNEQQTERTSFTERQPSRRGGEAGRGAAEISPTVMRYAVRLCATVCKACFAVACSAERCATATQYGAAQRGVFVRAC
jgi:hypothetical protein